MEGAGRDCGGAAVAAGASAAGAHDEARGALERDDGASNCLCFERRREQERQTVDRVILLDYEPPLIYIYHMGRPAAPTRGSVMNTLPGPVRVALG
eukprot:scaffold8023_cov103-Isochrysis_galbana.AAC.19